MRIQHHRTHRHKPSSHILWQLFHPRHWKRNILWGGLGVFLLLLIYTIFFLPSVKNADSLSFAESTIIYDREALNPEENPDEHILYIIHGDENREYVPLEEISPWIRKATVAIEDDSFYRHFGFDIGGVVKGFLNHFFGIGNRRGGSTITQQLVKNTFLTDRAYERTVSRKFKEILLSMKVEWTYTKDEILEMYLNNIPYGSNAHGIEAAAKTFFGKSSRELTLGESAILASLPLAPTRFSPHGANKNLLMGYYEVDTETGEKVYRKGRKDLVLERLLDLKMITFDEFSTALSEAKDVEFKTARTDIKAPHFVFYVREKLEQKYGKDFLKDGGLRIYTTLDPELQTMAEEIVQVKSAHYPSTYGAKNVALTALNPETGEILAYVGGKDYFDTENDGQVDVLTSRRQPGSSFKPYVYAAAFEKGYVPATTIFDVETDFGGNYTPQNFDGTFAGPVSMREALNRSLNIPAVKAAYLADPKNVLKLADEAGVTFEGDAERHGVAVGIGVSEVEPLSHIAGYQVFAADGSLHLPSAILEVHNSEGEVLEKFDPKKYSRAGINPETAGLIRNVLTDETTRGVSDDFEWNKLLQLQGIDNGAKTGTSNRTVENPEFNEEEPEDEEKNPKEITAPGDSWTIGFSPHLVGGVWVGNNKGEPMKPGATGLAVAAPIWKAFMTQAHEKLFKEGADPEKPYPQSKKLEVKLVNRLSGKLATDQTPKSLVKEEVFASFSEIPSLDDSVKEMDIDRTSGRLATRQTPGYTRQKQFVLELNTIRPDMPNWREPVEKWIRLHPRFMTSLGTIMDDESSSVENLLEQLRLRNQLKNMGDPAVETTDTPQSKNAPRISILSPKDKGTVAPGQIQAHISAESRFPIVAVEYYLDGELVAQSSTPPYSVSFTVSKGVSDPENVTLKALALDKQGNVGRTQISFALKQDTTPPNIVLLGPIGKQRIPIDSYIGVLADVQDYESGVKVVEFFLDGQSLGFDRSTPYEKGFTAIGALGQHDITIKAMDIHGNLAEKTIPVIFERQKLITENELSIDRINNYRNSVSVDVLVPNNDQLEWVELVAEQGQEVIFSGRVSDPSNFVQFQIPKNGQGRARLKLYGKEKNNGDLSESRIRFVEL